MFFSALLIFGSSILAAMSVSAGGDFSHSCQDLQLEGSILSANCRSAPDATPAPTTLDVSDCISVNPRGLPICAVNGRYADSCSPCEIRSGSYMTCSKCVGPSFMIDLDDCIMNSNGRLTCVN
ncbi:Cyanovirin-N [Ceratobasidium sp. AG-I]|nr:Cyanovirin-N [Ceratobasidium sp. AG-I]